MPLAGYSHKRVAGCWVVRVVEAKSRQRAGCHCLIALARALVRQQTHKSRHKPAGQ